MYEIINIGSCRNDMNYNMYVGGREGGIKESLKWCANNAMVANCFIALLPEPGFIIKKAV